MKKFCNAQIMVSPDGRFIVMFPSSCRQFVFDDVDQMSQFLKRRLEPDGYYSREFRKPRSFYTVETYVLVKETNYLPF